MWVLCNKEMHFKMLSVYLENFVLNPSSVCIFLVIQTITNQTQARF
jgi:hypothetical protein